MTCPKCGGEGTVEVRRPTGPGHLTALRDLDPKVTEWKQVGYQTAEEIAVQHCDPPDERMGWGYMVRLWGSASRRFEIKYQ